MMGGGGGGFDAYIGVVRQLGADSTVRMRERLKNGKSGKILTAEMGELRLANRYVINKGEVSDAGQEAHLVS